MDRYPHRHTDHHTHANQYRHHDPHVHLHPDEHVHQNTLPNSSITTFEDAYLHQDAQPHPYNEPHKDPTSTRIPSATRTGTLTRTASLTRTYSPTKTPSLTRAISPTRTSIDTRTPTSTAALEFDQVVLKEFLPQPERDWNEDGLVNGVDEYIEIINLGSTSVDLSDWKLDNGPNTRAYTLTAISMLPREILVYFRSDTNLPLSNGSGTVWLLKPDRQVADSFHFPPTTMLDRTSCRLFNGTDNLKLVCIPTPRRPNIAYYPDSAVSKRNNACGLEESIPAAIEMAECDGIGAKIWNEAESQELWLAGQHKFPVFIK